MSVTEQKIKEMASKARLPDTYEAAKAALEKCYKTDECRSWADKEAALASYIRQAKDNSLELAAIKIRARAIRRFEELRREIAE